MLLSRHSNNSFTDLSLELSDELDWKAGTLKAFEHHLDITALAYEPVSGILAIGMLYTEDERVWYSLSTGTSKGVIDLYGDQSRGVVHRLELEEPVRIRNLYFASSLFKLVCVVPNRGFTMSKIQELTGHFRVDGHDRLIVWDLTTPRKPKLQSIVGFRQPIRSVYYTLAFVQS